MSHMTSSLVVLVTAIAIFAALSTAYPTKDDEAYYRLQNLADNYNKEVRNLDGIDSREEMPPLITLLTKTDQAESSEKGSHSKYQFGSGLHLDGIGGGHLVRDLEAEQGLGSTMVGGALQAGDVDFGASHKFGVVQEFPTNSESDSSQQSRDSFRLIQSLLSVRTTQNSKEPSTGTSPEIAYNTDESFTKALHDNSITKEYIFPVENKEIFNMKRKQDNVVGSYRFQNQKLQSLCDNLDPLGGGHLLGKRPETKFVGDNNPTLDSIFLGDVARQYYRLRESLGESHFLDALGGDHLVGESPVNARFMDSIGGGHLLRTKDLDYLGGGHLIKEFPVHARFMDSLGGGHLLRTKDLDYIGGGHLIRESPVYSRFIDSLGGGHLLSSKKNLDSLGGGHLIREFPVFSRFMDSLGGGHLLSMKKDLDSLGGGHLIRESPVYSRFIDSLGGGHLLSTKRNLDSLGGGHLIREFPVNARFMDSLGGGHLLSSKRNLDSLGGGHLIREFPVFSRFMDSLGGGHLLSTKKNLNSLAGGHLIQEPPVYFRFIDSLGGGNILGTKKNLDSLGGGHLISEFPVFSRFMDSIGGGHLLSTKKNLDSLGGGHLIRESPVYGRFVDSIGEDHTFSSNENFKTFDGDHILEKTALFIDLPNRNRFWKYPYVYSRVINLPNLGDVPSIKHHPQELYEISNINKASQSIQNDPPNMNKYMATSVEVKITPDDDQNNVNPVESETEITSNNLPSEENSMSHSMSHFKGVIDLKNIYIPDTIKKYIQCQKGLCNTKKNL